MSAAIGHRRKLLDAIAALGATVPTAAVMAGTTTKELAEAASISEALLFRHFPSKKHLYSEILRLGCEGDPALDMSDLGACAKRTFADAVPGSAAVQGRYDPGSRGGRRRRWVKRPMTEVITGTCESRMCGAGIN